MYLFHSLLFLINNGPLLQEYKQIWILTDTVHILKQLFQWF